MKKYFLIFLSAGYFTAGAQTKSKSLEGALTHPAEVTELNLNGSHERKALPADIAKLTNLKILKLYGCSLETICPEIGQLKNLEVLDLGGNYLKTLPAEIGNLPKLKELNLKRNGLTELPEEIGNLAGLTNLDLSYNKITSLPLGFYMLKNLVILNLEWNEIKYLSQQVKELSKLELMSLSNNKLESLPDSLWFTPKLYTLNLYKCGAMLSIPKNFCDVPLAFSTVERSVIIDKWHLPGSFIFPSCSYVNGIRKGWLIKTMD